MNGWYDSWQVRCDLGRKKNGNLEQSSFDNTLMIKMAHNTKVTFEL